MQGLCMRWPKYWSFSFSIIPSKEIPRLIFFRMDWLDLLAVQGTLKSLQHHSSKASILQHSAFFTVQLSHPNMTTGKTIGSFIKGYMGSDVFACWQIGVFVVLPQVAIQLNAIQFQSHSFEFRKHCFIVIGISCG